MKTLVKRWISSILEKFNLRLVSNHKGYLTGNDLEHDLALFIDRPSSVCIDVGANVGQTVEMFHKALLQPVIHAFEPSANTFSELEKNVANVPDLQIHRMAAGSKTETKRFKNLSNSQLSSFLTPTDLPWLPDDEMDSLTYDEELLNVVTLDDYFSQKSISRVDILKSDTQGFELEVLKGAKRALEDGIVSLVLIEMNFFEMYSGQANYMEIFTFLEEHGYYVVDFYEKARSKKHNGTLSWCTALFARRDQEQWSSLIPNY